MPGAKQGASNWHGPPYSVCPLLFALISSLSSFGPCQFALSPVQLTRTLFVSDSTSPASFLIDGCDMKVHICLPALVRPPHTSGYQPFPDQLARARNKGEQMGAKSLASFFN